MPTATTPAQTKRGYELPDVEAGWRTMCRGGWMTIVASMAGLVYAPNHPLMTGLGVLAGVAAMRYGRKQLSIIQERRDAYGKKVANTISSIPVHRDAAGNVIVDPKRPTYEPEDISYERIEATEQIRSLQPDGTEQITVVPWYRDVVTESILPIYRDQEAYLAEQYPRRHGCVRNWWLQGFVVPALFRRHTGYEFRLVNEGGSPVSDQAVAVDPADPTRATVDAASRGASETDTAPGTAPTAAAPPPNNSYDRKLKCMYRKRRTADTTEDGGWADVPVAWAQEIAEDYRAARYAGVRIALQPQIWTRRMERRPSWRPFSYLHQILLDIHHGAAPQDPPMPERIRHTRPIPAEFWAGTGYMWDTRHIERYHAMLGENQSDTLMESTDGDPRIYACGAEEATDLFIEEEALNLHSITIGAPGTGKTRWVANIIAWAIEAGKPIIILDPKLDRSLVNTVVEICRKCGRYNRFHLYHFNAPHCKEVSSYNPMYRYDNPEELASRAASVIPRSKDPFWFVVGLSTARAVVTLSHYVMDFLRIIGTSRVDGRWRRMERYSDTPPRLLLALLYLQSNPSAPPEEADAKVGEFLENRRRPDWTPADKHEKRMLEMCRLPFYSPKAWNPSLKPVNVFGVGQPEIMVAWALKIVYFHLFMHAQDQKEFALNGPDMLRVEDTVTNDPNSWWQRYIAAKDHPIQKNWDDLAKVHAPLVQKYYTYFLPPGAVDLDYRRSLEQFHESLRSMRNKAAEDRPTYQKHMSTLQASLSAFEGEREPIVSSIDPDIILKQSIDQGGVVYMALNHMKDQEACEGMSRIIVADCLSHLGETYGFSRTGSKEFYFIADEIASFITKPFLPMMAQGRGAGVRTLLLGQSMPDLEDAMESSAAARRVIGNTSIKVAMRLETMTDAKDISERAGKRTITIAKGRSLNTTPGYGKGGLSTVNGYSVSENRSWDDREVDLVPPNILMQLPTFQCILQYKSRNYMVMNGLLPRSACNILKEFGILRDEHERELRDTTSIEARRAQELAEIDKALRETSYVSSGIGTQTREALATRVAQTRDRDIPAARLRPRSGSGSNPGVTNVSEPGDRLYAVAPPPPAAVAAPVAAGAIDAVVLPRSDDDDEALHVSGDAAPLRGGTSEAPLAISAPTHGSGLSDTTVSRPAGGARFSRRAGSGSGERIADEAKKPSDMGDPDDEPLRSA